MKKWMMMAVIAVLTASLAGCADGKKSGAASQSAPRNNPLAGTSWSLVTLAPPSANAANKVRPWKPKAPIELRFAAASNSMTGRSICHDLTGNVRIKNADITLGTVISRKIGSHACLGEELAQERVFLNALQSLRTFRSSGGRLELIAADQTVMTFAPLP